MVFGLSKKNTYAPKNSRSLYLLALSQVNHRDKLGVYSQGAEDVLLFLPRVIHFSCLCSIYSESLLCWRFLWNLCWIWLFLSPCRDDHGFSPLHWACREGRSSVVDMLIMRGARINVMNRGDDTPLHLAASHGHRDIVGKVWKHWGIHTVLLKKVTSWFLWSSCNTTVELLVTIIRIWATSLTLDHGWLSLNGLFVRINLIKCQIKNSFSLEIKLKTDARAVKLTSVSPLQANLPV